MEDDPTVPALARQRPFLTIPDTCELSGNGRSKVYEKIGAGRYRAVKDGAKTLVETQSVLDDMASLPPANIKPQKTAPRRPMSRTETAAKATEAVKVKREKERAEADAEPKRGTKRNDARSANDATTSASGA